MMRLWEWLKRRLGWVDCPGCQKLVRLRWVKIPLVFEDEPPMLFYYCCPCGRWDSPIQETIPATKAARDLGYSSALELLQARQNWEEENDAQDR